MSVSVKWLAVKTASEMTYTVSGGALNSTQPQPPVEQTWNWQGCAPRGLFSRDRGETETKAFRARDRDEAEAYQLRGETEPEALLRVKTEATSLGIGKWRCPERDVDNVKRLGERS